MRDFSSNVVSFSQGGPLRSPSKLSDVREGPLGRDKQGIFLRQREKQWKQKINLKK